MTRLLVRAGLILLVIGALTLASAAGPAIGLAVTDGGFQVDHSRVFGNTTLFDGSIVETSTASSQLRLMSGVEVRLAAASRARVYLQKAVLERGYGQLFGAGSYELEAATLRISASAPDAVARVRVGYTRVVTVAAVRGAVSVRNAAGVLVASIEAGRSLDLQPQDAGAAAPTHAAGCLLEKSGKFIVADQTTNVILEIEGDGLEKKDLGNKVEITGTAQTASPAVPGASQLIKVAGIKRISKGGCAAIAKKIGAIGAAGAVAAAAAGSVAGAAGTGAAGAAGVAGAAAAAGIGVGTVAVVGGVAAAATLGGLAVTDSLPGQGETLPRASR